MTPEQIIAVAHTIKMLEQQGWEPEKKLADQLRLFLKEKI